MNRDNCWEEPPVTLLSNTNSMVGTEINFGRDGLQIEIIADAV